ncbi:hypothetical protein HU200_014147 [Digitaria exilis]|uniref:Uncharacterized protein n=1 Tax=Digitaria exilis TaxID=1010633 RepID=A0A835FD86_9POAL|nr:hypothetical protein HU200_014147 [Digitaria exilis]
MDYQYTANQIFGNCLQASVPNYSGGQLVEYASATQKGPVDGATHEFVVDVDNVEMRTRTMLEETATEFKANSDMMKKKMHRESGHSIQEVYGAVVSAAQDARQLYDKVVMAGISDDDFLPMMFYDACFLVQYLYRFKIRPANKRTSSIDPSLANFFYVNHHDIFHDILLLENQIPWVVVEAILRFRPLPLKKIIAGFKGALQDRKDPADKPFVFYSNYKPPHFLGLLRFYIVGRSNSELPTIPKTKSISFSVSAIELAEIGIRLTPSKSTELINMGMTKKGPLFAELSLVPLTVDSIRTRCLVNMAAFEICSVRSFSGSPDEDSAVCSYLLLFSMIVDREEDVHELRTKHLLQGGGGLTNNEALHFFTRLSKLRLGSRYYRIMKEIESYKVNRPMLTKFNVFFHKNKKAIITVVPIIAALIGILGTLMSLKSRSR